MPKLLTVTPNSIGHRLDMSIAWKATSKLDVANKIKCSGQAISQLISGKLKSRELLKKISHSLNVDSLWLIEGRGPAPWERKFILEDDVIFTITTELSKSSSDRAKKALNVLEKYITHKNYLNKPK